MRYMMERRQAWGREVFCILEGSKVKARCDTREDALQVLRALEATEGQVTR